MFQRQLTVKEIVTKFNQGLVPLLQELRDFEFPPESRVALQNIFAEDEDYVKAHSTEIGAHLSVNVQPLKSAGIQIVYNLRWCLAMLTLEDYEQANREINKHLTDYLDAVDQIMNRKLYNDILQPVTRKQTDRLNSDIFGGPDVGDT